MNERMIVLDTVYDGTLGANKTLTDEFPFPVTLQWVKAYASNNSDATLACADEGSNTIITGYTGVAARTLTSSANPWAGRFGGRPLTTPWLEDATITGYSAAYWYLFADPNQLPCYEISYLDGKETPAVEYFGMDTDPDTLGMSWRVVWDFGVDSAEWRAGIKSAGA